MMMGIVLVVMVLVGRSDDFEVVMGTYHLDPVWEYMFIVATQKMSGGCGEGQVQPQI